MSLPAENEREGERETENFVEFVGRGAGAEPKQSAEPGWASGVSGLRGLRGQGLLAVGDIKPSD